MCEEPWPYASSGGRLPGLGRRGSPAHKLVGEHLVRPRTFIQSRIGREGITGRTERDERHMIGPRMPPVVPHGWAEGTARMTQEVYDDAEAHRVRSNELEEVVGDLRDRWCDRLRDRLRRVLRSQRRRSRPVLIAASLRRCTWIEARGSLELDPQHLASAGADPAVRHERVSTRGEREARRE